MGWPGRKTRRWALGCGPVLAILTAAIWLSWPRERLLMEIAHPVFRIDITINKQGHPNEQVYWLASNRFLIITTEHEGDERSIGRFDWKGQVELFNTDTHSRTRLVGLTNLLNGPRPFSYSRPNNFALSPNGSRLYWSAYGMRRVGSRWSWWYGSTVSTLDGSEHRDWKELVQRPSYWMDDQHMVDLGFFWFEPDNPSQQLTVRDIRNSHGDRHIALNSAEATSILASYGPNHPLVTSVNSSSNDDLIITRKWFNSSTGQIVHQLDTLIWPKDTQAAGWPDQSPHQNSVALLWQHSETPLLMAWIHRVLPFVTIKPTNTEALWVTPAGSHQLREIGHVPLRTDSDNVVEGDQLEQVMMLPDGKQISFVFKGMLYVVPVKPKNK
jgi:hypothetical protein